ncbi:locomotion-related protein Hikaru genki-like isoform X2 [Artemia franciscana]|nr:hypothetical protein QYM36_009583 [Artemia franciscana]
MTYLTGTNGSIPQTCKIKCVDNQWVGPFCTIQSGEGTTFQALLRGCHFPGISKQYLKISYRGKFINNKLSFDVENGETLFASCPPIGRKKLLGQSEIHCFGGRWSHPFPSCLPTATFDSLTDEGSPQLQFYDVSNNLYETPEGQLLVRPGAVVHIDCIFPRKVGVPQWTYTQKDRHYPTGWSMERNERDLNYRISVIYAKYEDTGIFTCATPHGHANSISLVVKDVSCSMAVDVVPPLFVNLSGVHAGQEAFYSCAEGYRLIGEYKATCLQSGNWSSPLPTCEVILCNIPESHDPRVDIRVTGLTLNSEAKFACPHGYKLYPNTTFALCTESGLWTVFPPICKEIICPPLLPPLNGYIEEGITHTVGEKVHFRCSKNYILRGKSVAVCKQSGDWSADTPFCVSTCKKPYDLFGSTSIEPRKARYLAEEKATVTCNNVKITISCRGYNEWQGNISPCLFSSP